MIEEFKDKNVGGERVIFCNRCKQDTKHIIKSSLVTNGNDQINDDFIFYWSENVEILKCNGCGTTTVMVEESNSEELPWKDGAYPHIVYFPNREDGYIQVIEKGFLPWKIQKIYSETIECYRHGLVVLCVAGIRATLEGVCQDRNVKDGIVKRKRKGVYVDRKINNLEGKINGMCEAGFVSKRNIDILHTLRIVGNDAVHELSVLEKVKVEAAISILNHILTDVYVLPEKQRLLKNVQDGSGLPL
ncbi:DUF4145 domain-containing protein [Desulfovibrio sulfodismutans]|uniref:DUF4145 domain-containing protein n=1 Tax=Desulfolutivibrio sulfodismutans TaxID=63561 RepID=A0A7K3NQC3_9BACT|nr:DUF4145 domain-containing protein [Desulfolutivibrio sulfodismutans]NDY58371.1 DUF4145 domain-containing protein [Desulfolutivibrio sulfodismutans]QLA13773.1 DUF4145 domain-containing protein [Desulfolutivibrio sulfodismutans DSM 3696]